MGFGLARFGGGILRLSPRLGKRLVSNTQVCHRSRSVCRLCLPGCMNISSRAKRDL